MIQTGVGEAEDHENDDHDGKGHEDARHDQSYRGAPMLSP